MQVNRISTTATYIDAKCSDILKFRIHQDVYDELQTLQSYKRPTLKSPWVFGGTAPYSAKYGRDPKTVTLLIIERWSPSIGELIHGRRYNIGFFVKYVECTGFAKFLTELETCELLPLADDEPESEPVIVEPQAPSDHIPVVYTTIARVKYITQWNELHLDPDELTVLSCNVPTHLLDEANRVIDYLKTGGDPEKYTPGTTLFDNWYDVNHRSNTLILLNRKSTNLNTDSIAEDGHYLFTFRCEYVHGKYKNKLMHTLLSFEPVDHADTSVEHAAHMATKLADLYKPRIVDMAIRLEK